jgi:hypothetical protein
MSSTKVALTTTSRFHDCPWSLAVPELYKNFRAPTALFDPRDRALTAAAAAAIPKSVVD